MATIADVGTVLAAIGPGVLSKRIALALPGIPGSVPAARRHVRETLGLHGLGEFAQDAAIITSELVANAVQHACGNGAARIGVTLTCAGNPAAVTVVVSDSSPQGPVRRETPAEQGRGLQIVEALSARWGWRYEDGGKTVFAVLAREV
jgi:anti-sigma regulatory factor (Ser/Thr protein kinase)